MDERAAIDELRARLPEFGPAIDEHLEFAGDDVLFHPLMGDLARFYWETGRHDPALARRLWMAVDHLVAEGTDRVENAVAVSCIEWFAWGSREEADALIAARPMMSRAVWDIAAALLEAGGR